MQLNIETLIFALFPFIVTFGHVTFQNLHSTYSSFFFFSVSFIVRFLEFNVYFSIPEQPPSLLQAHLVDGPEDRPGGRGLHPAEARLPPRPHHHPQVAAARRDGPVGQGALGAHQEAGHGAAGREGEEGAGQGGALRTRRLPAVSLTPSSHYCTTFRFVFMINL